MRRLIHRLSTSHLSISALSLVVIAACDDYTCQDTATCVFESDGGASTAEVSTPQSDAITNSAWEAAATAESTSEPTLPSMATEGNLTDPRDSSTSRVGGDTSSPGNESSTPENDRSSQDAVTSTAGNEWSDGDSTPSLVTEEIPDATSSPTVSTLSSSAEPGSDTPSNADVETSGMPPQTCGDGVRQGSEECDDGNGEDDDGCLDCTVVHGWRCSGSFGTESACVDIDECHEGTDNCDVNAACLDLDGSFECSCDEGYSGNGEFCQNVDECQDDELNDCHADAICTDTIGSFTCECKPGFEGDGPICVEETHVTKLAISNQICALINDGRVFCWAGFALGNGQNDNSYQPVPTEVSGITTATDVTVGGNTVCVLLADKTVKCWGADDLGQASGTGTSSTGVYFPNTVSGLSNVVGVSNTNWTTCVLLANGTVRCFGSSDGTAGSPTATRVMSPLSTINQLSRPAHEELCGVASDGSVKCWAGAAATPTAVSGVAAVTQVAGRCALLAGGSVKCWGPGGSGQIGNGSNDDQATPQLVQQLGAATRLAAGRNHVCALLDDHSVSCWGKDGFFSPIDYGNLPLPISGLSEVVEVYAGGDNSCAIEADHTVKCWGSNLGGQLGEDREGNEFSPVVVHGLPGSE